MRRTFRFLPLLLPLAGCLPPPGDAGYGAPQYYGYPQGYPPGYAPGGGYPGYSYNDGVPSIAEGGVSLPLVFFGGEWGYYDHERRWRRAPEHIERDLERRRSEGAHFHPDVMPRADRGDFRRPEQPHFGQQRPEQPRLEQPRLEQPRMEQPRMEQPRGDHPHREPPQGAAFVPPPRATPAAAPAQPQREQHDRRRDCPPGQRC
jgi:hypothetical protein